MKKQYKVVDTEKIELGRFAIRLDTIKKDGREYPYSYVEIKDSVVILAKYMGKFIFVRQYRHSVKKYLIEIPGGAIEGIENKEEAARRELLEETGFVAGSIISLGSFYPSVGSSNEECFLFFTDCLGRKKQRLEPLEFLTIEFLSVADIESLIRKGELLHSMALIAWLKYKAMGMDVDRENKT